MHFPSLFDELQKPHLPPSSITHHIRLFFFCDFFCLKREISFPKMPV